MTSDKTLRIVFGAFLLLIGIPGLWMAGFGGMMTFGIFPFLISITFLILGVLLIIDGLRKGK